jgi:hypothetical protein
MRGRLGVLVAPPAELEASASADNTPARQVHAAASTTYRSFLIVPS